MKNLKELTIKESNGINGGEEILPGTKGGVVVCYPFPTPPPGPCCPPPPTY